MRLRAALTLGIALASLSGCGRDREAADEKTPQPEVSARLHAVETRRFDDVVTAPGQWRSGGEAVVAAPFAGIVESLTVRVGDRVRAGQRLGLLETRESSAALKGAELMLREAKDPAAQAEAEKARELARRDVVRVPLVTHHDGVIVRRSVEPGAQVAEAAEVLAVVPWNALIFEAHVPAGLAPRVHPGQAATITGEGQPARAATVQRLLPVADSTDQTTLVWLALRASRAASSADPAPELERFGAAAIVIGAAHRATAVPDSAVVEDDLTGERRIAVIGRGGALVWTPVTLGATQDGWREIVRPPLPAGTMVIVEGQRGLPGGTRVTPAP